MPLPSNAYGPLAARVYHIDKYIGRSFGDVEFYRDRLALCPGPVLEPAVGNGRMLIPLLQAGLDVEGFDASPDMLALCRAACEERGLPAPVRQASFDDFSYGRSFAAAIIPAGSFQLITDYHAALRFLRRLRGHLLPGGRVILDIDPARSVFKAERSLRTWEAGADEMLTLASERVNTDYTEQTIEDLLRYELWQQGRLAQTCAERFRLRWWGVHELHTALLACGFAAVTVSGGYEHGRPPREGDSIVSFEAHLDG